MSGMRAVIYRDEQKIVTDDLNNGGLFARASLDALVEDAISNLRYYTGFSVTKAGQTELAVGPGRYWGGGPVFTREEATSFNVLTGGNYLPVTTKRIVAVVVWGEAIETDTQERSFEIDDQGNTEPQSVAMTSLRYARLAMVAGIEGPDPQRPTLDATVIPVAWVKLTTSGVDEIVMETGYVLPSVESLSQLVDIISTWKNQIGLTLDTILSELARIQAAIPPNLLGLLAALLARIEALEAQNNHPPSGTPKQTFVDKFLSERDSDTAHLNYDAVVGSGLRFPHGVPIYQGLELADPLNPRVKTVGNITLPKYSSERARTVIWEPDAYLSIVQYPSRSIARKHKLLARKALHYYDAIDMVLNGQDGQAQATYSLGSTFQNADLSREEYLRYLNQDRVSDASGNRDLNFMCQRNGAEVYDLDHNDESSCNWTFDQLRCRLHIRHPEPYWMYVTKDASLTGCHVAQSFTNPSNGWLTSIDVAFYQVDSNGANVQVLIAEMEGNRPHSSHIVGRGVITPGNVSWGAGRVNTSAGIAVSIQFGTGHCTLEQPVFMQGGKSYAIILVTTGNHWLAVRQYRDKIVSGCCFYMDDNDEWIVVQNSGDICMMLNYAVFDSTRVEVSLAPGVRGSGISYLKLMAAQWEPEGTRLIFEGQRAGLWYQLSDGEYECLGTAPTQVPLRMIFQGTRDLMPGIDLSQSELMLGRTVTSLEHWSKAHALDVGSTDINVKYFVRGWNAAAHTLACHIVSGGVTEAPDTGPVYAPDPQDNTKMQISYAFTMASTQSYVIKTEGDTTDAAKFFTVTERDDYAM